MEKENFEKPEKENNKPVNVKKNLPPCKQKININLLLIKIVPSSTLNKESPDKKKEKATKTQKKIETIIDTDKLNMEENRRFSKFSSMIIGDKVTLEEKKKLGIYVYDVNEVKDEKEKRNEVMKKLQKYGVSLGENEFDNSNIVEEKEKVNLTKFLFKNKKKHNKDDIINFKSKSVAGKNNNDENEKRDNANLIDKFKLQFDKMKIKNIDRPDKLEHFINDKFVREKTGMAKKVEELNRIICNIFSFFYLFNF